MVGLRWAVAAALLAVALSAPTWTGQLSELELAKADSADGRPIVSSRAQFTRSPTEPTTPSPAVVVDGSDGDELYNRPMPVDEKPFVRYGPWTSVQDRWNGKCVYTGIEGRGKASCNVPLNSHTWRYVNQTDQ